MPVQHLDAAARERQGDARPGVQRAYPTVELGRVEVPLELTVGARQLAGARCERMILLLGLHDIQLRDRVDEQVGAERGEPLRELRRRLLHPDRRLLGGEDRAVVELLVHLHDRDAGALVAGQDRMHDGRRAAPAGEQRRMHVDDAASRERKHLCREDLTVGGDDEEIGVDGP